MKTETTVCDKQIQHDNSGVGHNWRNIDASEIPADIREEIEGEIVDGKLDSLQRAGSESSRTIQVHTYEEAVAALANQTEDGPIVIDPNGDELFEGDNGPMYSDGASASVYGPLSE